MQANNYLVTGVIPANNEKNVAVDSPISITFSIDMNPDTITNSTIQLKKVNGETLAIAVTYSKRKATIVPQASLELGVQYQITVVGGLSGVRTIVGDYLPESKTYIFTTVLAALLSEPKSLSVSVTDGYPTASWTQPDAYDVSFPLRYEVVVSTSNIDPESNPGATVWPSPNDINTIASTTINIPKKFSDGSYYLYIRSLNGESKSAWVTKQFAVTTQQAPAQDPTAPTDPTPDPTPVDNGGFFEVVQTYPKADAADIKPDNIVVIMNNFVNQTSVTSSSFYIVPKGTRSQLTMIDFLTEFSPAKALPATVSVMNNILTLTPTAPLEVDQEYTVIIRENVSSTNGDTLGEAYSWSFLSEFTYLYGDADSIRNDVGGFIKNLSDKILFKYMADVSRKAYDIVSTTTTFVADDYADGKAPFAIHQYVRYQTEYDLLLNAYIQQSSGGGTGASNASVIKLGDLQVEGSSSAGGTGTATDITSALSTLKDRIKHWEDAVHGHHNRGYAKPVSVVKGEIGAAYPAFLTRAEFSELGE